MALMRVGGRDQLNVISDSPLPRNSRTAFSNVASPPASEKVSKCRPLFSPRRISGFPSPLNKSRFRKYVATDGCERSSSFSHAPRQHLKTHVDRGLHGDDLSSFSFSPAFSKGSFTHPTSNGCSSTNLSMMKGYWHFRNFVAKNPSQKIHPAAILNPNKAVMTIDNTGKILTANDMTFVLFGTEEDICDTANFLDFITSPSTRKEIEDIMLQNGFSTEGDTANASISNIDPTLPLIAEEDIVMSDGLVVFCGKVISVTASDIGKLPVSLWMKRLPMENGEEPRWITVMEPVKLTKSVVTVNEEGIILKHDDDFRKIFGYDDNLNKNTINIFNHITSLKLPTAPDPLEKQQCTGHTFDGVTFPISVCVSASTGELENQNKCSSYFDVKLKMFSHISGLVVVDENAYILEYNHSFMRLLFGYGANELKDSDISQLLPDFHDLTRRNLMKSYCDADSNDEDEIATSGSPKSRFDRGSVSYGETMKENRLDNLLDAKNRNKLHNQNQNETKLVSQLSCINSEGSSVTSPNKAFVISDSQVTLGLSTEGSTSWLQKNIQDNVTSYNSTSVTNSTSQIGSEDSTERRGSPNKNATPVMRDITNSMDMLSLPLVENMDISQIPVNGDLITSTPATTKYNRLCTIQEGAYVGSARHKDGSDLSVIYQICKLNLAEVSQYCIWIMWEPEETFEQITGLSGCGFSSNEEQMSGVVAKKKSLEHVLSQASICQSPASSQSQLRCAEGSSSTQKSSVQSVSEETNDCNSTNDESLTCDLDIDSPIFGSPVHRSLNQQVSGHRRSRSCESDEDSNSVTYTDGSSEDEYSISYDDNIKVTPKRRSLSEGAVRKPTRRDSKGFVSSLSEVSDDGLIDGEYQKHYSVLRQIGKGAFGYVKLSYRHRDGLLVVTKFIKKDQVYRDSWKEDEMTGKRIPLEVLFLLTLDHPNIVKAYDYFENDDYFQLVMEKWGSGMDLFEFIERNPALDESLTSYIFRQIVSPLVYLKAKNIIHRDIKDENIIINHKFQIKLIDFGSATYWELKKKYSQFAGTIEYCSPEVIKGTKYHGHEVEVWSLGITLYTLIYGENPFFDTKEILTKELLLPITYSEDLCSLLHGMLDKHPDTRITLNSIAEHPWTNQPIEPELYNFEDIVDCNPCELAPYRYISEYGDSEVTMSTTSSSFVYEDRQSLSASGFSYRDRSVFSSATESTPYKHSVNRSEDRGDTSTISRDSATAEEDQIETNSSRTSTSRSSASMRSTVTIDSSILTLSPHFRKLRIGKKSSESSESANESTSSNHSHSSSFSNSTNSIASLCSSSASLNSSDSYITVTDSSSSCSYSGSVCSKSDSDESLVQQQDAESVYSSSSSSTDDDNTLNTDFSTFTTVDDDRSQSDRVLDCNSVKNNNISPLTENECCNCQQSGNVSCIHHREDDRENMSENIAGRCTVTLNQMKAHCGSVM